MRMILRYEHRGISVKRIVEAVRVRGKKGMVAVKVNRRKVKMDGVEDSQLKWEQFTRLLDQTLLDIVNTEPIKDEKWRPK